MQGKDEVRQIVIGSFLGDKQVIKKRNQQMSYSPCEWSDFPPLFIVRAQGSALKPALPHPSFCFISHWSHNAGLTLCLLTQRACESQIQQDDFAAVWLTGKCSLIWKTFFFSFKQMDMLIFATWSASPVFIWHWFLWHSSRPREDSGRSQPALQSDTYFSLSLSFSLPAN